MLRYFIFFLFFSVFAYGQIKFGATAGLNISRFHNKYHATNGSYFNFNSSGLRIGLFSEIPVFKNIVFSPKLIYNQIGDREKTNLEFSNGFYTNNIDYKLDYLSIPLNLRFFKKLYVEAGPQFGFLLNQTPLNEDIGETDSNIDFGGNLEIGYAFNDFRISVNAYHGVVDVFELSSFNRDYQLRNFSLSLNFGYIFY